MSTAFERAQAHYDSMSPSEPRYFAEKEQLDLCFDTAETGLSCLFTSIDTHERLVPREHQDRAEIRAKLDSLRELIEEEQSEFGGALFEPLQELAKLSPNLVLVWRSGMYWVEERLSQRVVAGDWTPALAVLKAKEVMSREI